MVEKNLQNVSALVGKTFPLLSVMVEAVIDDFSHFCAGNIDLIVFQNDLGLFFDSNRRF